MSQAMNTAMSGMTAGQQQITVVADNIANINTVAFKESSVNFQDIWYETKTPGTAGANGRGGTNPMQMGVGTMLSSVNKNFEPSTINTTGRTSDMALQGNGFFTLMNEEGAVYYTRAGNFTLDPAGYLCSPNGYKVVGTNVAIGFSSSPSEVKIPHTLEASTQPRSVATLANKNVSDINASQITEGNFKVTALVAGVETEVTVTIPNPKTITMQGLATSITSQLNAAGVGASCVLVDGSFNFELDGSGGNPVPDKLNFTAGTSSFVQDTQISIATLEPGPPPSYAAKTLDYTVDIKPVSDIRNALALRTFAVSNNGVIEATYSNGDKITVYTDATDGTKRFKYTMSTGIEILGPNDCTADPNVLKPENLQMQFANVTNVEGLIAVGSNMYTRGPNTGDVVYSQADANGVGAVRTGGLESSNVDMARQFSNMILAQRAIEANSRVFDTANAVLQTLVYLGRGG